MLTISRRGAILSGLSVAVSSAAPFSAIAAIASLDFVNPELRPAARQVQQMMQAMPPMTVANLGLMRASGSRYEQPALKGISFAKRVIPGLAGNPDVTVFVVNAKPGAHRPGVLHTHGGGFVEGSARSSVWDLQKLALAFDCGIVTVEYRLAPEINYAGSIEDNYTALRYLHDNAAALGVDPTRLAVMGESAGGGHAALLAITARDRGEVPLAFQALTYPMLDDRTGTLRTPPSPIGSILWTADKNRFGWRCFLGQEPGGGSVPVAVVPARTVDLRGLPPAFIGVGSIDLFVEEDIEYARRLIDAGVATELLVVPGAFHGFDGAAADTLISRQFTATKIAALRVALT